MSDVPMASEHATITASEITAHTHVWVGDRLLWVETVRVTSDRVVSINGGAVLLAPDRLVVLA